MYEFENLFSDDRKKMSELISDAKKAAKRADYKTCKSKLTEAKSIVTKLISELEKTDDTFFVSLGESLILSFASSIFYGIIPLIGFFALEIGTTKSLRQKTTNPGNSETDYTKSLFEKILVEFKRNPSKAYALRLYKFVLNSIENSIRSCDKAMKSSSSFIGKIAQESYNEGYHDALVELGIIE